jgi:WD40 repeat protein
LVASLDRSLAIIELASGRKVVETRWKWPSTLLPVRNELLVCASQWDKAGNDLETFHLFDLATLKQKRPMKFREAAGKLQASRVAATGRRLALLVLPPQSDRYRMTIWNWPEAVCIGEWHTPIADFAWAPDGSWIATLTRDGVALVEPCSGETLWNTGERQHGLAVSPDGHWLVSSNHKGVITIWNIAAQRKVREFSTGEKVIHGLGIFPENRFMVACCDQQCLFWEFSKLVAP